MLMLSAEELAKAMYEAWRKRMDLIEPRLDMEPTTVYGNAKERLRERRVASQRARPRPRWEHLTSIQQSVWRDVARDIGGVLADAMGDV